ncbi:hypothetical protein AB0D71_40265 [Streptomyces avermitilis]|uniref:hypothetical protein n=1 Tax=Streptomyces avermitilis TaxID=33903 RepID=UPI00340E89B6
MHLSSHRVFDRRTRAPAYAAAGHPTPLLVHAVGSRRPTVCACTSNGLDPTKLCDRFLLPPTRAALPDDHAL